MKSIFLPPGEGRAYPMGRISALFKANGDETAKRYSISEWWLKPNTQGPGAPKGSFVLAAAGTRHDFENRSSRRAGILNFSIPGGFEDDMPAISQWFAENPPQDARR
jgi:hypothetical protein